MLNAMFASFMKLDHTLSFYIDGWMTCDFALFSTVFQSYQDDGQMIMKVCVQLKPVYGREDFASSGAQTKDR